eukprot:12158432-Ditylum_brightwellii.AAC.1
MEILPEIPQLIKEKGYQYIWIYEGVNFLTNTVKQDTKKEYLNYVCSILKADLTSNSAMTTICAYAVPVMCYTFGILWWTQAELQQLDKNSKIANNAWVPAPQLQKPPIVPTSFDG